MRTKGIYLLYRLCLIAAMPLIILYFSYRSLRTPVYFRTLGERLGWLPGILNQTGFGAIWLHAVSVGEVLASVELLKRLRMELPSAPLYCSVSTVAGRALATRELGPLADGIFYAPLDFVFAVRRVLRRVKPRVVVVMETEIWPNLFREVKRAGCGLIVVNGRISERALPRYRKLRWFFRHVLIWPDAILAQSAAIRQRFIEVGAPAAKVIAGGNLKYDFQPGSPPPAVVSFVEQLKPDAVWIAASTMPPDEDETVIGAFQQVAAEHPGLLLILAPRKPERFDLVARRLEEAGARFVRRSALGELKLPGVLLLDSMGELSGLFALADVVFMGGSIVTHGGHNILEPAMFSKPIVAGPYMQNFREMAAAFRSGGALVEVATGAELSGAVGELLREPERAAELGRRAKTCSEAERGATAAAVSRIRQLHEGSVPRIPAGLALRAGMGVYHWGSAAKRRYDTSRKTQLSAPVISVGNLTMGGSGKTPMTLYLAERLSKPAILTRGYRRRSKGNLILAAGAVADSSDTGDEAQMFLQSRLGPIGIGADRAEVGRLLAEQFAVEHFILDDGFQHWRLDRQVDIVLVDALDPFPPGRLREPMEALARADIFVITRSRGTQPGIERELRARNTTAPIFYSAVVPECWIEGATGERLELSDSSLVAATAFCGLANPGSFWASLSSIGLQAGERIVFPDHTRYDADAIGRLLERHGALVTTEKDWINLGPHAPSRIYWLKIRIELDREKSFIDAIQRQIGRSSVAAAKGAADRR